MAGLTSQQERKLSELMSSGFEDYAVTYGDRRQVGALTDSSEKNTSLIRSCGAEFVRILEGQTDWREDLPQLREDLFNLIERGCPKIDIVDLLFACTRGRTPAVSDTLKSIGLADPSLQLLSQLCQLVSEKISALNRPGAHGPLFFFSELLPELPDDENRRRLIDDLHRLPELLSFFGNLLSIYPPKKELHVELEPILRDFELFLFYELLSHFNVGHPTLSRLLRTMRRVRYSVLPKAQYVRRFGRVRVTRDKRSDPDEPAVRDPFGETALQRRLHRFSEKNGNWHFLMVWVVVRYLSDEWSTQRAGGATLLSLLPQLLKPMNITIPVIVRPDAK